MQQYGNYQITLDFEWMYRKGLNHFRHSNFPEAKYWCKLAFDSITWQDSAHPLIPSIISLYRQSFLMSPNGRGYKEFHEGLRRKKKGLLFGFEDKVGRERVPCVYEDVDSFRAGLGAVKIGGRYGFIDKMGRLVIRPQFDQTFSFYDSRCIVQKNTKWGVIDELGKTIFPFIFDEILLDDFDLMISNISWRYYYINNKGVLLGYPECTRRNLFLRRRIRDELGQNLEDKNDGICRDRNNDPS